jgi:hypothetical protein
MDSVSVVSVRQEDLEEWKKLDKQRQDFNKAHPDEDLPDDLYDKLDNLEFDDFYSVDDEPNSNGFCIVKID